MTTTRVVIRIKTCTHRSRQTRKHHRRTQAPPERRDSAIALTPDGREDEDTLDRITLLLKDLLEEANAALGSRSRGRPPWQREPSPIGTHTAESLRLPRKKETKETSRVRVSHRSDARRKPRPVVSASEPANANSQSHCEFTLDSVPYRYPRSPNTNTSTLLPKAPIADSFQRLNASMVAIDSLSRDLITTSNFSSALHTQALVFALFWIPFRHIIPALVTTSTQSSLVHWILFLTDYLVWLCLLVSAYTLLGGSVRPSVNGFRRSMTRLQRPSLCAHDIECQAPCNHGRPIHQLFSKRRYSC